MFMYMIMLFYFSLGGSRSRYQISMTECFIRKAKIRPSRRRTICKPAQTVVRRPESIHFKDDAPIRHGDRCNNPHGRVTSLLACGTLKEGADSDRALGESPGFHLRDGTVDLIGFTRRPDFCLARSRCV